MKLLIQPEDGVQPIVRAIRTAKKSIALTIFRLDRNDITKALEAAVERGLSVHALIANTNGTGEKPLRKLELRLLESGVTVSRTGDDLVRFHDKIMIVDATTLYVLGFNFTALDMDRSRSFGIVTKNRRLVQEAIKLFDADATRQTFSPTLPDLVVSPENARQRLTAFLKKARKQLLIYDPRLSDPEIIKILLDRAKAGVEIRIIGKVGKKAADLKPAKLPKLRLHVRAICRDGVRAFIGSQSLRKLELDNRREAGVIIRDPKTVRQLISAFEDDWASTQLAKEVKKEEKKEEKAEEKKAEKAEEKEEHAKKDKKDEKDESKKERKAELTTA